MGQLYMLRKAVTAGKLPEISLPDGYSIRTHKVGKDEQSWCEVCESLNREIKNPDYCTGYMLRDKTVMPHRMFYAVNSEDKPVATATLRIRNYGLCTLHMVETRAEERGHGIGKAVCIAAVSAADKMNIPCCDLTTDDFRIPAIKIYLSLGFLPVYIEPDMQERWAKIFGELGMEPRYLDKQVY